MDTRAVVVLFSIVFALSNSHPLLGGKKWQQVDSFENSLKSSMRNKMFSMLLEEAEKEAEDEPVLRSNYRYVVLCRY